MQAMMGQTGAKSPSKRIDLLDAYRTIAIAWVGLFHYAWFWSSAGDGTNLLPYDNALSWIPLSSVGHLGVTLFFLISGYVIALTLQTTATFKDFAIKRFARLWPPLLICGAITFAVVWSFGPPELRVSLPEALISMTLIPPQHVARITGAEGWGWLDGAYWSLWVEVRFYVVIGLAFYIFRKRWLEAWLAFEAAGWLASLAYVATGNGALDLLDGMLFGEFAPYFTIGVLALRKMRGQTEKIDIFALVFALAHAVYAMGFGAAGHALTPALMIGYAIVLGLFAIFVFRPKTLSWLEQKPLLSIGRASYSFYLLHQVVGISLLTLVAAHFGAAASLYALPFIIALLLFVSNQIFHRVEQPTNRWIVNKYVKRRAKKAATA